MVDPVTVQILRNKVAGLVEEMHYHFYRSGYSTIIRESRDFSCVIVDAAGGLIVAPPMFFHAPVYKHLVGAHYRDLWHGRARRRRHVRVQPPLRGRAAACLGHGFRRPDLRGRGVDRLRGIDRAQGRYRRHQPGQHVGQRDGDLSRRPAAAADPHRRGGPLQGRSRTAHPDQQPPAGAGAGRHAGADRRHPTRRGADPGYLRPLRRRYRERCLRRYPRRRRIRPQGSDRRSARRDRFGGRLHGFRRDRTRPAGPLRLHGDRRRRHRDLRFQRRRPPGEGPDQPPPLDGRGVLLLRPDRLPRPGPPVQRRHARGGALRLRAPTPSPTRARRRRSPATRWPTSSWST